MLGVCAAAEALGFLLVWTNMVPRYRHTMWRRRTVKEHAELTRWEDCTSFEWGPTRNDSRAQLLGSWSNAHWPRKALITAWLRENWEAIQSAPWFTPEWRAHFPKEWLEGMGKKK